MGFDEQYNQFEYGIMPTTAIGRDVNVMIANQLGMWGSEGAAGRQVIGEFRAAFGGAGFDRPSDVTGMVGGVPISVGSGFFVGPSGQAMYASTTPREHISASGVHAGVMALRQQGYDIQGPVGLIAPTSAAQSRLIQSMAGAGMASEAASLLWQSRTTLPAMSAQEVIAQTQAAYQQWEQAGGQAQAVAPQMTAAPNAPFPTILQDIESARAQVGLQQAGSAAFNASVPLNAGLADFEAGTGGLPTGVSTPTSPFPGGSMRSQLLRQQQASRRDVLREQSGFFEQGYNPQDYLGPQGPLSRLRSESERAADALGKLSRVSGDLNREQQKMLEQAVAAPLRGAVSGAYGELGGDLFGTPELQQAMGVLGGMGGGRADFGEWFGGVARRAMSGWELMRMRRQWQMTGGWAMGQIPVAAGQEQAYARAAMVGVPMGEYQPSGMALDIMSYQARQEAFTGAVGRGAYGAWGWTMGAPGGGVGTALGIGMPAMGAGLVGAGVLGVLGIPSGAAAAAALPIAGGAAVLGGGIYAGNVMQDRERMAIAAAGGGGKIDQGLSWYAQLPERAQRRLFGGGMTALTLLSGGLLPGGAMQGLIQGITGYDFAQQTGLVEQGQQMIGGNLAGLTAADRMASIRYNVQEYGPEWMGETAKAQALGEWMRYTPGAEKDLQGVLEDPRFSAMTMRGETPATFAQTAMQWGMSPLQWQNVQGQMYGVTETQAMQNEFVAGQYRGLMQLGFGGADIRGGVYGGLFPQMTQMEQMQLGRLTGGDRGYWSAIGRGERELPGWMSALGAAPADWMVTRDEMGLPIGTATGGEYMMRHLGQVGAPGAAVSQARTGTPGVSPSPFAEFVGMDTSLQIQAGQVIIGTDKVDFTQWGLQDYATQQQRGYQTWQEGFQQAGLNLTGAYMTGTGEFAGAGVFPMRREQLDIRDQQFGERWGLNRERLETQGQWGAQDLSAGFGRQMTRLGWRMEDLDFRGATSSLQFGWQMEDIQESMRYATGRERRRLMEQRERATITYGMGMGQLETQRGRVRTQMGWAEEDHDKARDRHQQRLDWNRRESDMSMRHHNQNMDFSRRRLAADQRYWEMNHARQNEALQKAREYRQLQNQIQDSQTALARAQQIHLANFQVQWVTFFEYLEGRLTTLESGGTVPLTTSGGNAIPIGNAGTGTGTGNGNVVPTGGPGPYPI